METNDDGDGDAASRLRVATPSSVGRLVGRSFGGIDFPPRRACICVRAITHKHIRLDGRHTAARLRIRSRNSAKSLPRLRRRRLLPSLPATSRRALRGPDRGIRGPRSDYSAVLYCASSPFAVVPKEKFLVNDRRDVDYYSHSAPRRS